MKKSELFTVSAVLTNFENFQGKPIANIQTAGSNKLVNLYLLYIVRDLMIYVLNMAFEIFY